MWDAFTFEITDAVTPGKATQMTVTVEKPASLTARDPNRVAELLGEAPWWTSADPEVNSQGAHWQHDLPHLEKRLRKGGLADQAVALEAASRREALHHRKQTIEQTRLYREVSAYVVTGEVDTPISTAGVLDDAGQPKHAAADFRRFNSDTVLLLGWDRCRVDPRGRSVGGLEEPDR